MRCSPGEVHMSFLQLSMLPSLTPLNVCRRSSGASLSLFTRFSCSTMETRNATIFVLAFFASRMSASFVFPSRVVYLVNASVLKVSMKPCTEFLFAAAAVYHFLCTCLLCWSSSWGVFLCRLRQSLLLLVLLLWSCWCCRCRCCCCCCWSHWHCGAAAAGTAGT